jgi:uncharacterized membrane protein
MKRLTLLAATLLALVAPCFAQYQFTPLDFPGSNFTTARGINDHGDIVGAYRLAGPRHALLIRKAEFLPIAPTSILGAIYSEATNINNQGDITGQMIDDFGFVHGFLVKDGAITILDVPGASDTFALGINDSGLVVGYWDRLDAEVTIWEIRVSPGRTAASSTFKLITPVLRALCQVAVYLESTRAVICLESGFPTSTEKSSTASFARSSDHASATTRQFPAPS